MTEVKKPTVIASAPVAKKVAAKKVAAKKAPAKQIVTQKVAAKKAVAKPVVAVKQAKVKLVRDSFTMPARDFALIAQLKERALGFKRPTKKSELLRAGLQILSSLSEVQLSAALSALEPIPAGRPKKTAA
ncbi:MAG: hypothetical protein Q7U28_10160 [Aquabacterium sp.]|nr:hypothetical protein [Aquabacterium sp.]